MCPYCSAAANVRAALAEYEDECEELKNRSE
jgi:hypothetical protein